MKKIYGYWVDNNNNKWDCSLYTKEQAENASLFNCFNCVNCFNCDSCSSCDSCYNFKSNPERITSPDIGSRNSQTTYYWNDEIEQIVCGCFRGKMEEFKARIKEIHNDNEHAKAYFAWIERVEKYKNSMK